MKFPGYRCRLSPNGMIDLPDELLTLVLLYGTNDGDNSLAMTASHVSRDWRRLALDVPEIWSKIHFRFPYTRRWPQQEKYLHRSRAHDLDIEIHGELRERLPNRNGVPDGLEPSQILEMISLIKSHSGRWQKLIVDFVVQDMEDGHWLATLILACAVPRLATCRLNISPDETRIPRRDFLGKQPCSLFAQSIPIDLDTLYLSHFPIHFPSLLSFRQLSVLIASLGTFHGDPLQAATQLKQILATMPMLKTLDILASPHIGDRVWTDYGDAPALSTVESVTLERLQVPDFRINNALYPSVRLPVLSVLESIVYPENFWPIIEHRPFPMLRSLFISGGEYWDDIEDAHHHIHHLPMLLEALPGLCALRIRIIPFPDDTYIRILSDLCPQLTELSLIGCSGISVESLQEVVTKRRSGSRTEPLASLQVRRCRILWSTNGLRPWFRERVSQVKLL
jgi:hypothetical protein